MDTRIRDDNVLSYQALLAFKCLNDNLKDIKEVWNDNKYFFILFCDNTKQVVNLNYLICNFLYSPHQYLGYCSRCYDK